MNTLKTPLTRSPFMLAFPLLLVLFIDSMGLSLLFPILNSLVIDSHAHFLPANMNISTRDVLYGVIVGTYMICWFFGAVIMGDLSDYIGRKKSLVVCLVGTALGYFLSGIAVIIDSVTLLIVARVIAGFTAGSQAIAQAAMVDIGGEEHKARNISLVILAMSLGFTLGPVFGGILSNNHLVSWFTLSTPFYFAAIISAVNIVFLWWLFEETTTMKTALKFTWYRAIEVFSSAMKDKRIRNLCVMFIFLMVGWANYYTFISIYLLERFHYTTFTLSMFMMVMALGFSVGSGVLVDFFSNRFSVKQAVSVSAFVGCLAVFFTLFASEVVTWVLTFILGAAICIAYSLAVTWFSNQVGEDEQGWIMGVSNSIGALSFGVVAFLSGFVAQMSAALPLILSTAGLGLAASLVYLLDLD